MKQAILQNDLHDRVEQASGPLNPPNTTYSHKIQVNPTKSRSQRGEHTSSGSLKNKLGEGGALDLGDGLGKVKLG
jgi:hypothetical protein